MNKSSLLRLTADMRLRAFSPSPKLLPSVATSHIRGTLGDIAEMVKKMNEKYILVERSPSAEEYRKLREAVGWWDVDAEAIEIGLGNSLFFRMYYF